MPLELHHNHTRHTSLGLAGIAPSPASSSVLQWKHFCSPRYLASPWYAQLWIRPASAPLQLVLVSPPVKNNSNQVRKTNIYHKTTEWRALMAEESRTTNAFNADRNKRDVCSYYVMLPITYCIVRHETSHTNRLLAPVSQLFRCFLNI